MIKLSKIFGSTLFRLLLAVVVGVYLGHIASEGAMDVVVTLKHITGELIFFIVPLIVVTFISSSIAKMGKNSSKLLFLSLVLAYLSSVGAAYMAMGLGYAILPSLSVGEMTSALQELPPLVFELNIPPIMGVMSALTLAIMIGLSAVATKSEGVIKILDELQKMVLSVINKFLIPILPIFVAANFTALSYEGALSEQLPLFLNVVAIAIATHFVWLLIIYAIAALVTQQNPWLVVKNYARPYFTAVGTMSSAATLPVTLISAHRSTILDKRVIDFAIPLFSNIHLCGSILTEVFFIMAVSQILYGALPSVSIMVLFIALLAIFAIGAPGVPGGTVIASLGVVSSVVGFDSEGTALLLTIFAIQDSFGTACNIVGDGALTMIVSKYATKIS